MVLLWPTAPVCGLFVILGTLRGWDLRYVVSCIEPIASKREHIATQLVLSILHGPASPAQGLLASINIIQVIPAGTPRGTPPR